MRVEIELDFRVKVKFDLQLNFQVDFAASFAHIFDISCAAEKSRLEKRGSGCEGVGGT